MISDDPIDLLEGRCTNLLAMLPESESRPLVELLLQSLVMNVRLSRFIGHLAGVEGPLSDKVRADMTALSAEAQTRMRTALSQVEALVAAGESDAE